MIITSVPIVVSLVFFGLLGLGLGSFGNMMLYRIASGKAFTGRSFCPRCKHQLAWYDLIPVISFALLGGHCRYCRTTISTRYPLIEIASMGFFFLALGLHPADLPLAIVTALLLWGLLLVVAYDAQHQLIPDIFTLIVFLSALSYMFLAGTFLSAVAGCVIALAWFGGQWIVSQGRYIGSGDILLGASLGLWLGWKGTVAMLFLAYIIGALWAVYLLLSGLATRKSRIAFGPLLALGAVIATFGVGNWYFSFFGF